MNYTWNARAITLGYARDIYIRCAVTAWCHCGRICCLGIVDHNLWYVVVVVVFRYVDAAIGVIVRSRCRRPCCRCILLLWLYFVGSGDGN